jgi:hypothetical protein
MHRGRVRISYDPAFAPSGNTEYNTAMTEIVDIGSNNDFTIEVGWHNPKSYLGVPKPGTLPITSLYGTVPLPATAADLHNGVIYVHVMNELTTPATSPGVNNDIKVNVFVSASDVEDVISDSSAPLGAPVLRVFGNKCQPNHAISHYGDPIVSIRSAIKRYVFYRRTISPQIIAGFPFSWIFTQSSIPWLKGKGPAGNVAASAMYT